MLGVVLGERVPGASFTVGRLRLPRATLAIVAGLCFGMGGVTFQLLPAGLVGALLVLVADFAGQHALGMRFPVGVVTGVLGAPYLVYLIVRSHRAGGSA